MGLVVDRTNMKAFVISALVGLACAAPDVSSPASISHGHGPVVAHASHVPHHAPVHHAPIVHHAPVHHAPIVHHAPVVHHAPAVHHAAPYHPAPAPYHPAPKPAYHAAPVYKEEPAPYAFEYGVADDYSKAQFNAAETADGNGAVTGSYSVALPDGRTQHVKYTADHYNGYVADVSYEGVPHYPEAKPYHPAPAYKPAPAYHA